MNSYRIGNRKASDGSPESSVLRSLFELRKDYNMSYELTFWNCEWTSRIVKSLHKLLARDGRFFSTIKFFDCNISKDGKFFAEILTMILSNNATESLIIKVGNGNNRNEEQISPTNESSLHPFLDGHILTALRKGISNNTSIKSLRISGLTFNDAKDAASRWWESLIQNKTITKLDLTGSRLSNSTVTDLSTALSLNTSLESIDFSRCYLEDKSISLIVQCIKQHPSLSELNLSQNYLAKGATTQGVDAIADLLRYHNNNVLTSLNLSHQQQPKRKPHEEEEPKCLVLKRQQEQEQTQRHALAFQNAFHALSVTTMLEKIDLSGNIGCFANKENVKALCSCLVSNNTLRHVDISSCHLDNDGIEYLAQNCLPRCSDRLKSLILFPEENDEDTNGFLNESAMECLTKGLQFNTNLESLGGVRQSKCNYVQHLLNSNQGGRRIFQSDNLPIAAWSYLLARAGNIQYNNEIKNICNDDERNNTDNKSLLRAPTISSSASASVLFDLLRGPALLAR